MKNVKSIEIVFENCDYMIIDANNIGSFYISGLDTVIHKIGKDLITKEIYVNDVSIELLKDADKEHYEFGYKDDEYKTTVFERLFNCRDITHIHIHYEDDSEECYLIDYEEEAGFGSPNKNEDTAISKEGNLYIVINKNGKKAKDIFYWEFEPQEVKE